MTSAIALMLDVDITVFNLELGKMTDNLPKILLIK